MTEIVYKVCKTTNCNRLACYYKDANDDEYDYSYDYCENCLDKAVEIYNERKEFDYFYN